MHSQELDPGSLFQLKSWTRPFVCVPFKSRYSVILSSPPGAALSGSHPIQKLTSGTLPNQKILFYNLKISTSSLLLSSPDPGNTLTSHQLGFTGELQRG